MFLSYLEQARLIRAKTEQNWAALKGWRMEDPTPTPSSEPAPSPDTTPSPSPDPAPSLSLKSPDDQIKTLELTLTKEREARKMEQEARKIAEAEAKKAAQYRAALGELDPIRLDQIHKALSLSAEHDATLARAKSEAAAERDLFHNKRISELEEENQQTKNDHYALKKRLAIQRHFVTAMAKGLPEELEPFMQWCGNQFEYDEKTDQITKVKDAAGQEIFVNGKSATPIDLLLELRQGKQGRAIAACFEPYNQSNGGGIPITGPNGQLVGDLKSLSKESIATLAFK